MDPGEQTEPELDRARETAGNDEMMSLTESMKTAPQPPEEPTPAKAREKDR